MRIGSSFISALVIATLSTLFLVGIPKYIHIITAYEGEASPRLFPFMMGILLLFLSLALAVREFKKHLSINIAYVELKKVVISFIIICVGIFLIPILGFAVATTLILLLLTYLLGNKNILSFLVMSLGWFTFVYFILIKFFAINFPQGLLI